MYIKSGKARRLSGVVGRRRLRAEFQPSLALARQIMRRGGSWQ